MNYVSNAKASLLASDAHMSEHKYATADKEESDSNSTGSSVDAVDISYTMYRFPTDMFFSSPEELPVTKSAQDGDSMHSGEEESLNGRGLAKFDATKRPRRRSESDIAPLRRETAGEALDLVQEDTMIPMNRLKKLSNKLVGSGVFQVVLSMVWHLADDMSEAKFAQLQLINRQCYE